MSGLQILGSDDAIVCTDESCEVPQVASVTTTDSTDS